jgi:hypothetical protein
MAYYKFIARLSHWSFRFIRKAYNLIDALLSGFWLGVMSEKSLDYSDELFYNNTGHYTDDNYNLSGLFKWEKVMIEKHFGDAKSILLIAAGGGREVLALSGMGYKIDAYECNELLVEYGGRLLEKNGIENKIRYLPRNSVPGEIKKYDGIIIGWGAYSLMAGQKKRIALLEELYPFLKEGAPLMISFLWTRNRSRHERIVKRISDFFRTFSKKDKTEIGDRLMPDFIHYFTEDEIRNEVNRANCRIKDYSTSEYGCLIAVTT